MKKIIIGIIVVAVAAIIAIPTIGHYSKKLCSRSGYTCIKIKRGDSWVKLWPNARDRDIVRRVNRTNTRLRPGHTIAVPKNLKSKSYMSLSPLPHKIKGLGRPTIYVDLKKLAFGAYNSNGKLLHWGPISGGKVYCRDVKRGCKTPTGRFKIMSKRGYSCSSSKFPIPKGGAPMPYCMFFFRGYAFHGSHLPGHHDSHGCIRLFYKDAKWLNRNFVKIGSTKVIVVRSGR